MSIDKVSAAYNRNEIKELLLGKKGYAIVYPHFFDLLSTDIYGVFLYINEFCNSNIDLQLNLENKIQKALEDAVTNSEHFLYCLRYIELYLKRRSEFIFTINISQLRNIIVERNSIWLQLDKQEWNGFNLLYLCKRMAYGFIASDGSKVLGINDFLPELDISLIPTYEIHD